MMRWLHKYRKFLNPKTSYIFDKTVISVACTKCGNINDTVFK